MHYHLSAATIHELEEKLKELKAKDEWLNRPELAAIKAVLSTLHQWVDPKAFVAGGCALSLKLGRPISDVDVYFTTPFNYKPGNFLKKVFAENGPMKVKPCRNDYENNMICNLVAEGEFNGTKYQFMCVDAQSGFGSEKFESRVLNSFDINLCKIGLNVFNRKPQLIETPEHLSDLENKTLMIGTNLSEMQLRKTTQLRLPKYQAKFPGFRVVDPAPIAVKPPKFTSFRRSE